jgi:hypothetical protein
MWDSILILIHHFNKPYKKKDLHYLINSRLNNDEKQNLIIAYDINIVKKCSDCKDFNPWIILKNCGESLFIIGKILKKYSPWVTMGIQENIHDFRGADNFNYIFILINKVNDKIKLYELINNFHKVIVDSDIMIKNRCLKCDQLYSWILIKNNKKGIELAKKINDYFKPFIQIKRHKTINKYNIPDNIMEVYQWNQKEERKYGKLKIVI